MAVLQGTARLSLSPIFSARYDTPQHATDPFNCAFVAAVGGVVDFAFASAAPGFIGPAESGMIGGIWYDYLAYIDGGASEAGRGRWNSLTLTLLREQILSNSDDTQFRINFQSPPTIQIKHAVNYVFDTFATKAEIPGITAPVVITDQWFVTTSDFVKTDDTALANIPGLSATLVAGQTYVFRSVLHCTEGSGSDGYRARVAGTCTATAIRWTALMVTSSATFYDQITNLASTALAPTGTGSTNSEATFLLEGVITVNAGGTFTVQFACQNTGTSSGDTSTVRTGSHLFVREIS